MFACILKSSKNFDVSSFSIIHIFYSVLSAYNEGCVNEEILYLFRKLLKSEKKTTCQPKIILITKLNAYGHFGGIKCYSNFS